jgi:hypothetical protein
MRGSLSPSPPLEERGGLPFVVPWTKERERRFGIWIFGASLDLGAWDLELSPLSSLRPAFRHWHAISFSFPRIDVSILDVQDAEAG